MLVEKVQGLGGSKVQDLADCFAPNLDIENLRLKARSLALFANDKEIREELHLDCFESVSTAPFTAASGNVERKRRGRVAALPGQGLSREDLPDRFIGFHVGEGVGSGGPAHGRLVHEDHLGYLFGAPDGPVTSGGDSPCP